MIDINNLKEIDDKIFELKKSASRFFNKNLFFQNLLFSFFFHLTITSFLCFLLYLSISFNFQINNADDIFKNPSVLVLIFPYFIFSTFPILNCKKSQIIFALSKCEYSPYFKGVFLNAFLFGLVLFFGFVFLISSFPQAAFFSIFKTLFISIPALSILFSACYYFFYYHKIKNTKKPLMEEENRIKIYQVEKIKQLVSECNDLKDFEYLELIITQNDLYHLKELLPLLLESFLKKNGFQNIEEFKKNEIINTYENKKTIINE